MSFDDHLSDVLKDDRWSLPVSPDTLPAVRRRRGRRRAARTTVTVLGVAGAVTAGALLVGGSGPARSVVQPGQTPPAPSGCDAPPAGRLEGSDYVVRSARDWFMTKATSDAFFKTYAEPSPKPEDIVPTPQPPGPRTAHLLDMLEAAGVKGTDELKRDDADSGDPRTYSLEGNLSDGRHFSLYRSQAKYPFTISGYYGSDTSDSSKDVVIEQVPGTNCWALLLESRDTTNVPFTLVQIMTPDGVNTGWGGGYYPLSELKQWAYDAARWEATHPAP